MADNILKAIISADGREFTKTLSDLQAQYKRFQDGLKTATSVEGIARINRALEATKQRMDALKSFSGLGSASSSFDKLRSSSNAANVALINTGRVFQDLPFGIIGVANNINPLLESFQRLQLEAKQTGVSLGSLLNGAFLGGGGLGLAVSVITGALSFAAVGLSAFTRGMGGASDGAKDLNSDLKALDISLENIVDNLRRVKTVLENVDWQSAIIDVKNFGKEGAGAVDLLNLKLQRNLDIQKFIQTSIDVTRADFEKLSTDPRRASADQKTRDAIEESLSKFIKTLDDLNKQQLDVQTDQLVLEERIKLQKLKNQKESQDQQLQSLKEFIERAKKIQERFGETFEFSGEPIDDLLDSFGTQLSKARVIMEEFARKKLITSNLKLLPFEKPTIDVEKLILNPKDIQLSDNKPVVRNIIQNVDLTPMQKALEFGKKLLEQTKENARQISTVLTGAFDGFFDALVSGQNVVKGFFDGLKQAILGVIKQLIEAAIRAFVFKALLSASGLGGSPLGKLLGGAISGGIGGISSAGGFAGAGSLAFAGGGAAIRGGGFGNIQVTGTLVGRGDSLVAIISSTQRKQGLG